MKNYYLFSVILTIVTILIGCSEEPPSIRIYNQHTEKANVQVKPSDGNTINHNDVMPGTFTGYKDIAEGRCEVTAEIQKDSSKPFTFFNAENDNNYIVIVLPGNPSTLRVDTKSK